MGEQKKKGYPLGFYISCIAYSFERFAFYGSKPLLVLFLIRAVTEGGLGMNAADAAILAANMTAFTYIAPVLGGYICDNWLGGRYAVSLGMLLMGVGYLAGWQAHSVAMVHVMIIVVSIGTGLFKGNLAAIIGRLFDDKSKLDSAFSVQYSFVNVGAFFGSMLTATLYVTVFRRGDVLGFRQCFLLCAILMFIGAIIFTLSYGTLQNQGIKPFKYLTDVNGNVIGIQEKEGRKAASAPLTKKEKKGVIAILFVTIMTVFFWLAYYQQDIALTIYMDKYLNMKLFGVTLTPPLITTTIPGFLCIFLSLGAAKIWAALAKRPQGDMTMFQKLTMAFAILGLDYLLLAVMEVTRGVGAPETSQVTVLWLLAFTNILTMAELCFSPLGNSFISKFAPKKYLSLLMGVWPFATFISSKMNGYVQGYVEKLGIFSIFITFMVISFIFAVLLFVLSKPLGKLTEDEVSNERGAERT